jgi:GTP-binding protein
MRFVDQCRVKVIAGDGGNGAVAFRREKFIPFGGPAGGDGGRGGDVVFVGDEGLSTLLDFTHARTLRAKRGEHGQGSDCHGRGGEDLVERVPVGTQIRDHDTGELVADVTEDGQRIIVAEGGKGGRGNLHFATPIDRAPRRAEKGDPGQARELDLTLKVMADVGLVGYPNAGKSTFVAAVSAARPKIADYPFTTLTPSLGVVQIGGGVRAGGTGFVIADIPGLIPGASEGVGLGIRFLQHVERTRVLLHLVTLDAAEDRDPLADYRAIRKELEAYSPELCERPEIVVLSKADLPEVKEAYPALKKRFATAKVALGLVSAATREGLDELVLRLFRVAKGEARDGDEEEKPKPVAKKRVHPSPPPKKANKGVKTPRGKATKRASGAKRR